MKKLVIILGLLLTSLSFSVFATSSFEMSDYEKSVVKTLSQIGIVTYCGKTYRINNIMVEIQTKHPEKTIKIEKMEFDGGFICVVWSLK